MEPDTESTHSERRLSTMLKHPLRRKSPNDSPVGNDHEDKGGLIRASIDKLKDHHIRHSGDKERRGSFDPGRRLSKLVPGRSKRKKSKQLEDDAPSEGHRGRTDDTSKGIAGLGISTDAPSEDSFGSRSRADSVTSSLLTDDEDIDPLSRPILDTRPSHAGYLTLSSPLITAEPVQGLDSVSESVLQPTLSTPATPDTDLSSPKIDSSNISSRIPSQLAPAPADVPGPRRPLQDIISPLPNKYDTPSTFVTPPTPDVPQTPSPFTTPKRLASKLVLGDLGTRSAPSSPPDATSTRRLRSATTGFGKIVNPLTPAIEEAKTPGGSFVQPAGSGSFFTSVFSATQNAVNQISNSFTNAPSAKNRNSISAGEADRVGSTSGEEFIVTNSKASPVEVPKLEPAIATLGSGNLSLSHLGISESYEDGGSMNSTHVSEKVKRSLSILQNGLPPNRTEEVSAAEAVTAAYAEKAPRDRAMSLVTDPLSNGRPRSIASAVGSAQGETTPPASLNNGVEGSITRRSNSVRSRISDRRRRHRNSSVATGSAIGAGHPALSNPAGSTRPSGFAVASTKRNKDFHQLFKSVPEDDYLVEDCSAALQRDILLQGRLYVSERHVCFSSNILGWVTNLVISFDEILAMEKKMTALVFPNAIMIQTLHAKNTFASLIGRETTYDLLVGIWRTTHPNLKTTEFGHAIDNSEGKAGAQGSSEDSEEESDEFYDEDDDDDGAGSFMDDASSQLASDPGDKIPIASGGATANRAASKSPDAGHAAGSFDAGELAGPLTHAPTECSDQASHFDKQLIDTTIPAPLGKIYSMMFGPLSGVVMRKFLLDDQKSGDLQMEDDKKGLGEDQKSNSYSFIKPLGASIGPKQTKCVVSQTLDFFDLDKAVSVTCSTLTPDVPSGNAFVTKTKYCLMWGPGNSTRLIMNCTVEWSAKSWLKGPIEKGANDGQDKYGKDIVAFFKSQVTTKSPTKSLSKSTKGKGRRKKSTGEVMESGNLGEKSAGGGARSSSQGTWGFLEPVHGVLAPVGDILGPLLGPEVILGALLFIMTVLWLRSAYWSSPSASLGKVGGLGGAGPLTPQRLAAYEELWRREESDLWTWLEDRIGLDGLELPLASSSSSSTGGAGAANAKQDALRDRRSVDSRLDEERMSQRQVEEAIRVTEEKLEALKRAVERRRVV